MIEPRRVVTMIRVAYFKGGWSIKHRDNEYNQSEWEIAHGRDVIAHCWSYKKAIKKLEGIMKRYPRHGY